MVAMDLSDRGIHLCAQDAIEAVQNRVVRLGMVDGKEHAMKYMESPKSPCRQMYRCVGSCSFFTRRFVQR